MRKSRLRHFQKLLVKERARILKELGYSEGIVAKPQTEASGDISAYTFHMADQGTDTFQREMESRFMTMEHNVLNEINHALERIASGKYGICESCGRPINEERLEVIPYTRYCVDCQNKKDFGSQPQ
ncbi:TraR/DksA family transcriptional regulator [candidate division WOR-3 bacterium]|uniref:TraR/DksA family transcriptional regulator n=1 Tax=candidate division WOR-3 bacterium TaxID=2052148 RepID=A0A660SKL0_UNCW3|nr:MAG: TraR/DksA family transcriptional regulator [candidate division WOR-3 bacterium]